MPNPIPPPHIEIVTSPLRGTCHVCGNEIGAYTPHVRVQPADWRLLSRTYHIDCATNDA